MLGVLVSLVGAFGDGIYSAISGLGAWLFGIVGDSFGVLLAALPNDPFSLPTVVGAWDTGMSWLNWFAPIPQMVDIVALWCAATVTYYVGRWALSTWVNLQG